MRLHRSPLGWAFATRQLHIARFLVAVGADIEETNVKGWVATFYLFGGPGASETRLATSCTEYLQLLRANSFERINYEDDMGWTAMHRAAIHGTGADVLALLVAGASPFVKTQRLRWTPMFMAVYYGNTDTFRVLTKYQPEYHLETDPRGWTLLHVAAGTGNKDILGVLMEAGADIHARTDARALMVSETLKGLALTAQDVALDAGPDMHTAFIDILKLYHPNFEIVKDEESQDLFWEVA